jgi:GGDEF domain-containing protein
MISIKRYLNSGNEEAVLWQVVCLLIEKIGSQAVQGERCEYDAFVANVQRIRSSITSDLNSEGLLLTAGSVVQAMTDYNQRVYRFIRRQGSEIQTIVSMLSETVVKMSGGNTRFAQNFQEIGDGMERAAALEDLNGLKLRLRDCLQEFRDEALKQKAEMEGVINALQQQLERERESVEVDPEIDPATGLPRQNAAEAVMHNSLKTGARYYVVTQVVNRMQSINARFGYHVGDQVLRTCRNKVEEQLQPGDQMFRWAGPALVLLLERAESLESVRSQMKRILDAKIEETYDLGSRSVMIPITMAWSAFKLISPVSIAVRQIQTFIASQSPRDFA